MNRASNKNMSKYVIQGGLQIVVRLSFEKHLIYCLWENMTKRLIYNLHRMSCSFIF